MLEYVVNSFLWTIFGLILGWFGVYTVYNKKLKKYKNIVKNYQSGFVSKYNSYFSGRSKQFFDENSKLISENSKLKDKINFIKSDFKNKLSEKYCQSEYIELNSKIKKQEKKIKEMYKIMPMYKDFYSFLNDQYKKKES